MKKTYKGQSQKERKDIMRAVFKLKILGVKKFQRYLRSLLEMGTPVQIAFQYTEDRVNKSKILFHRKQEYIFKEGFWRIELTGKTRT